MDLKSILKELSTLPANDLKTVKAHIDFLTKNKSSGTVGVIKARQSTIKGLLYICIKRYVSVLDIGILERTNPQHLDDKLEEVSMAIEAIVKSLNFDRRESMKLCQVITECAVEKIKSREKTELCFATLIYQMSEPRSLLDENFPGYINSGLFKAYVLGGQQ